MLARIAAKIRERPPGPALSPCRAARYALGVVWYRVSADTGSAGVGELEVDVEVGGRPVPVKTVDKGFRIFGVQFTPTVPSRHLVYVYFAGEQLTGMFCSLSKLERALSRPH